MIGICSAVVAAQCYTSLSGIYDVSLIAVVMVRAVLSINLFKCVLSNFNTVMAFMWSCCPVICLKFLVFKCA